MDYNGLSEEKLAELARGGDDRAIDALFHSWRERIKAIASLYFLAGGDQGDLIQEGMIGLFRAVHDYRSEMGASFRTFAGICVERQMLSAIKSADRLKHKPLNTSISLSEITPGAPEKDGEGVPIGEILMDLNPSPEDAVIAREQERSFEEEVTKSFSKFELEVWNGFSRGLSYTEIAAMLGRSPKSIDNAIQRMKKKVAGIIK